MRSHRYTAVPADQEENSTRSRGKTNVQYHRNKGICNPRLFAICLTLFIAIGAVSIIMLSTFYYGAEKEQEVFKRALSWFTSDKDGSDGSSENFPYQDIRLPKDIIPLNYKLYMEPEFKTFRFKGRTTIEILCLSATRHIVLHAKKLDFTKYAVRDEENNEIYVQSLLENKKNEQILLETENMLNKNQKYVLGFSFEGKLSNKMSGFYKSSYKTSSGETR